MDSHNDSAAVAPFFATIKPILDGEVVLHICIPLLGSVRQAEWTRAWAARMLCLIHQGKPDRGEKEQTQ